MKITSRTRIRIARRICKEFNLTYSDHTKLVNILCNTYDLVLTSKRWNILFFYPKNPAKIALLLLQYPNYVLSKKECRNSYY